MPALFQKIFKTGIVTEPLGPGEAKIVQLVKEIDAKTKRLLGRALAIRAAVGEEWVLYERKRGTTEYLWKAHYDSLVWLLFEGRYAIDGLGRFAQQSAERGLPERADQIRQSAAKLEESLAQMAKIF